MRKEHIVRFLIALILVTIGYAPNVFAINRLHKAASTNDLNYLESALKDGEDINDKDQAGNTPLLRAVKSHSKDVVKRLLCDSRVDLNVTNLNGDTALHIAARQWSDASHDIFEQILRDPRFKSINFQNIEGRTVVHESVNSYRNAEKISALLEHPSLNLRIRDNYGNRAEDVIDCMF